MSQKVSSKQRVINAAETAGININVSVMPDSTRTAVEAAEACGCLVDQIVKSLIFKKTNSGDLCLMLVSGANRVNPEEVAKQVGESLDRADPKIVREVTGFAIGGVAPIGHLTPIETWIDPHLLVMEQVWAAAGAPNAVFQTESKKLAEITNAKMLNKECLVKESF